MITEEYVNFFQGLEQNNHKDWFHANKKAYDKSVKEPFLLLLDDILKVIMDWDSNISSNAKDALFRINRDIRFAKDKTPYNILMKASFAPGGKRSELPGYYLGISADKIHVGGGLYNLKAPEIKRIRAYMATHMSEFSSILSSPSFIEQLGEIHGEKAKRLDKEFQELQKTHPVIANKQFYAMTELPLANHLNSTSLAEKLIPYFKEVFTLNQFLSNALA